MKNWIVFGLILLVSLNLGCVGIPKSTTTTTIPGAGISAPEGGMQTTSASFRSSTTTTFSQIPKAGEGEFCGGIAGVMCEAGLKCRLDGSYPDAGGVCVREQSASPKTALASNYATVEYTVDVNVPSYRLPLEVSDIYNINSFEESVALNLGQKNLLSQNGFTVIQNPFNQRDESMTNMYEILKEEEVPIFITTDSLLHLYHIQFDETLRIIEEKQFYDLAWNISMALFEENLEEYRYIQLVNCGPMENCIIDEKIVEAYRRNAVFFAVALELLKPKDGQYCADEKDWDCIMAGDKFMDGEQNKYVFTLPLEVRDDVEAELNLIEAHAGFNPSPVFKYKEDYSQYLPRGHYTRSEKLKNYFKALMWYGRISFLLKESQIINEENARIQTLQASIISTQLQEDKTILSMWDRIYYVTAFYVGFSDDLGPYEYNEALNKVFGGSFTPEYFDEDGLWSLREELAGYRTPKIYGGTGDCEVRPGSREDILKCLEDTKGFRMMGQRFIPDSYMFQNLVNSGNVGFYAGGEPVPFTYGMTGGGPTRVFPRGLDVMALLGSDRALELMEGLGDTSYTKYGEAYARMEEEFGNFSLKDWNQNLYWSWLYALKPLLVGYNQSFPGFMQSKAWQDKQLNTALASWTELRHDTILYAKQSYTMRETAIQPQPEKPVVGYVEPIPEFYARLLALTRMTNKGLDEMNVLDSASKQRLENLETILERLLEMSKQELENKELSQEDYNFIKNFGEQLNSVIEDVDEKAKKTTIIADVHTDANSGQVLEEAVGYVDMIIVAYNVPDGRTLVGAGPVFTYYEFKHPMGDRLTDEKWRELLEAGEPELQNWAGSYRSN